MKANECTDCGLKWEATIFSRIFLAAWVSILGLSIFTGAIQSEFLKSDIGTIVVFSYLGLLFVAPTIAWFIWPYRIWGGNNLERMLINYICQGAMLAVVIFYYANA